MSTSKRSEAEESSERILRERNFHNDRFGNNKHITTKTADRYNMIRPTMDDYARRVLAHSANSRVLEYGCGPNTYASRIINGGARSVVGIDISDEAIKASQENALRDSPGANMQFLRMNAEELEFESNSFDLVCGVAILHHLDLQKAIPEIRRVLTARGRCIFVEPLGHNPLLKLYRSFTPSIRTPDEHPLFRSDIDFMLNDSNSSDLTFHNFSSLPMHFVGRALPASMFGPLVKSLQRFDGLLFKVIPSARWWAWSIVVEFEVR
jgi:SAM-dependent methyltransferase